MITLLRPPRRDERGDERHLDGTGPRAAATLNGVVRLLDHRHFQWLVLAVCATATAGIITHLLAAPAALIAQILCIPAALLAVTFAALSAVLLTSALLLGRRNLELTALDGWPLRHLLLRLGAAVLLAGLLASPPMPEGWLRAPLACNSLLILASTALLALAPEDPLRLPPPGSPEASAALTPQRTLEIQYSMHPLLFPLFEMLVGRSRAIATAEFVYEGCGLFFMRLVATDAMKQHVANEVRTRINKCLGKRTVVAPGLVYSVLPLLEMRLHPRIGAPYYLLLLLLGSYVAWMAVPLIIIGFLWLKGYARLLWHRPNAGLRLPWQLGALYTALDSAAYCLVGAIFGLVGAAGFVGALCGINGYAMEETSLQNHTSSLGLGPLYNATINPEQLLSGHSGFDSVAGCSIAGFLWLKGSIPFLGAVVLSAAIASCALLLHALLALHAALCAPGRELGRWMHLREVTDPTEREEVLSLVDTRSAEHASKYAFRLGVDAIWRVDNDRLARATRRYGDEVEARGGARNTQRLV